MECVGYACLNQTLTLVARSGSQLGGRRWLVRFHHERGMVSHRWVWLNSNSFGPIRSSIVSMFYLCKIILLIHQSKQFPQSLFSFHIFILFPLSMIVCENVEPEINWRSETKSVTILNWGSYVTSELKTILRLKKRRQKRNDAFMSDQSSKISRKFNFSLVKYFSSTLNIFKNVFKILQIFLKYFKYFKNTFQIFWKYFLNNF